MESYKTDYNDNYIILADIHGNYEAFKAVVIDALNKFGVQEEKINIDNEDELRKHKSRIKGFIFLGDYAGDFPFGNKVIELMNRLSKIYEVYAIAGNREYNMAWEMYIKTKGYYQNGKIDIKEAEKLTGWDINTSMGAALVDFCSFNEDNLKFLYNLPKRIILENSKQLIILKHQMPLDSEELRRILKTDKEPIVLSAHTHEPNIGKFHNVSFFNPGSVGLTDNGQKGAYYGILNHGKLIHYHVDYDYERTISELQENDILYSKCENWGSLLEYSVQGINAASLYVYEKNRIINILKKLPSNIIEKLRGYKGKELKELIKNLVPILTKEEKPFATCLTTDFNPFGGYINKTTFVSSYENGDYTIRKNVHDVENYALKKKTIDMPNDNELPSEIIELVKYIAHEYVKKYCTEYANEIYISETRKKHSN